MFFFCQWRVLADCNLNIPYKDADFDQSYDKTSQILMFHFFDSSLLYTQSQNPDSLVPKFCQSWGETGAASPGTEQLTEVWLLCATINRRARADALTQSTLSFENRQLPSISNSPPPKFQNSPEAEVFFKKRQLGIMCSPTNSGERLEIKDDWKDWMHQWLRCIGTVSQILDKVREPWTLLKNKNICVILQDIILGWWMKEDRKKRFWTWSMCLLMQVKGWHHLGGLLFCRKANSLLGKRLKISTKRGIDKKKKPNPTKTPPSFRMKLNRQNQNSWRM